MNRIALTLTIGAFITSAFAQTPAVPHQLTHQWHKVADLPPGTPLLIRTTAPSASIQCRLAWIDQNAVACDLPLDGARDVLPIASVKSIAIAGRRAHPMNTAGAIAAGILGCALGGVLTDADGSSATAGRLGCLAGSAVGVGDVYALSR